MNKEIEPILINKDLTILETMKIINLAPSKSAPSGIALVVNETNYLLGIVTDGDIRRAIINDISLDTPIESIMNKNPITYQKGLSDAEKLEFIINQIKERKIVSINYVLIVDESGRIDDVLNFFDLWRKTEARTRNVCIVGLGYVGLTLAVTMADIGFIVYGIETNAEIVEKINNGTAHFHEVGLDQLIHRYINKKLFVSTNFDQNKSDVYIITVGTPVDEKRAIIMDYIIAASETVGKVIKKGDLIILRSTVPVGTSREVVKPIIEKISGLNSDDDFYIAFAPERTIEGKALKELRELPQIIGGLNRTSLELTSKIFREMTPVIIDVNSLEAAEMVKLINNTYRDVSFGFANELALICDKYNLDTHDIITSANKGYPRDPIPLPSPGVGGPCLTKDPYIFLNVAKKKDYEPKLIDHGRLVNEAMPNYIVERVLKFCNQNNIDITAAKIFIIGFAFKGQPETSDIRDSTTLDVLKILQKKGFKNLYGYDPVASVEDISEHNVTVVKLEEGFNDSDIILVLNNHGSYEKWDIYNYLNKMNKPGFFFDGWHLFIPQNIRNIKGIEYGSLGNE